MVMPDVELLVVDWLRLFDELADATIGTAFGPEPTWPAVRVSRISGTRPWPPWVDVARIQVEGWGATKKDALTVLEAALVALTDMPGDHPEGVVTTVDVALAPSWQPDPDTNQARYVADVTVTSHPKQGDGS